MSEYSEPYQKPEPPKKTPNLIHDIWKARVVRENLGAAGTYKRCHLSLSPPKSSGIVFPQDDFVKLKPKTLNLQESPVVAPRHRRKNWRTDSSPISGYPGYGGSHM